MTVNEAPRPRPGPEPQPAIGDRIRVADAVDQLCEQMAEVCASAVDSLEIAATLEAEAGLTGRLVRARYRFPHVFGLAEEMHRRTIRRPVDPEPGPDPWRATPATHLVHGVLYALPAVCYAVAAPQLDGSAALVVLVVTMVVSWTLSQGLSYLGYLRLGRPDPGGAARLLRCGLAGSALVLLVALVVTALWWPDADAGVAVRCGAGDLPARRDGGVAAYAVRAGRRGLVGLSGGGRRSRPRVGGGRWRRYSPCRCR